MNTTVQDLLSDQAEAAQLEIVKPGISTATTDTINAGEEDAVKKILSQTKDGVDVSIEAVGIPDTFNISQTIVRPGGHIANIGVHGKS